MLASYLRIAVRSLLRRRYFTAISLFGIALTLGVLLLAVALLDHMQAPLPPETRLGRTLHVSHVVMSGKVQGGGTTYRSGTATYGLVDRVCRDVPGVEAMSIVGDPVEATSFVGDEKVVSRLRRTDSAYWSILEFRFIEGRPFSRQEDENGEFVAVIGRATRRRLLGDQPAVGRQVEVGGARYRVVGVVEDVSPARYPAWADVWVPHTTVSSPNYRTVTGGCSCMGLLLARSTADFPRIRAEVESRLRHLELPEPLTEARAYPMTRLEQLAQSQSLGDSAGSRPPVHQAALLWLSLAAGFLLLPTVNLVNLNLSRILERAPEIGVRKAFGASSLDLVGQFVVENVLLCLVGGALGLALAVAVLEGVEASGVVPHARFDLNWRVFLHAAGLAVCFGALSGALPAWRMSRLHPVTALRGGSR